MPAFALHPPLTSLPGQCELCRRWRHGRLCADCAPTATATRCVGCGLRVAGRGLRCGHCLATPLPFVRCVCAVDYADPWDRLIVAYKYHGQVELAQVLADRLHAALSAEGVERPDRVLPVPLAAERLAERGYNQAWELARCIAARLGCTADGQTLERPMARAPQAGLGRAERRRNLQGAFRVTRPHRVAGQRIALVDDVLTTGATLAEAAQTLLTAGATEVQVWALARTP